MILSACYLQFLNLGFASLSKIKSTLKVKPLPSDGPTGAYVG